MHLPQRANIEPKTFVLLLVKLKMVNILVTVHSHFYCYSLYTHNFCLSPPRPRLGEERLI